MADKYTTNTIKTNQKFKKHSALCMETYSLVHFGVSHVFSMSEDVIRPSLEIVC